MGCLVTIIGILLIGGLIIEALPWIMGFLIVGTIITILIHYGKKELEKEERAKREKELRKLTKEIQDFGLPTVETTIMLTPREKCHYHNLATRLITTRRITGYEGRSAGYSMRVAKGFTVRQGSSRGTPIRGDVMDGYEGSLAITNRRVVFLGDKGFEFTYDDITALENYNDAIDIQVGKNRYVVSSKEIEKIQLILGTVLAEQEKLLNQI